jgi:ATP synthase protein I
MNEQDKLPSLEEFDARLRAAQAVETKGRGTGPDSAPSQRSSSMGLAFRFSIELVSAVAVGAGIGYAIDYWLGSKPWAMVVMLFLGGAAGVLNVYRAAKGLDDTVGVGGAERRKQEAKEEAKR